MDVCEIKRMAWDEFSKKTAFDPDAPGMYSAFCAGFDFVLDGWAGAKAQILAGYQPIDSGKPAVPPGDE